MIIAWLLVALLPATCAAASSPLYPPSRKEASVHRIAQVVGLGQREEILKLKKDYQRLLDSGIPDSALIDRSLAVGRVFCCGGGLPQAAGTNVIWFYVPPGDSVHLGDVVEVRMGYESGKGPAQVNRMTRVRERVAGPEHACRWEPQNDRLWMRVIYCDWMPSEGWTHKNGNGNPWYGPAEADSIR